MQPLPKKPLVELPVQSWTDFDSVWLVKRALREHEMGMFRLSSQVSAMMGRDDRIQAKREDRIAALLRSPLDIEPAGHAQRRSAPAKALEDGWSSMFPEDKLAGLQRWGLMLGVGLGELVWVRTAKRWMPTLHKVWDPRFLQWRWDTRTFWVQTMDGLVELTPGDRRWVLFTPFGFELGWMYGLVRSLAVLWLMRQWALRDWARYSEIHGMPIRKGIVPASAKKESKAAFLRALAGIGRETSIEVPQGQDGNRYDVELLEAAANTWEGFHRLLGKLEDGISIAVLGQTLTTEVKHGSKAAATVHVGIRNDIIASDGMRLTACLREQVLRPWAAVNFGDENLAPYPRFRTEPPEDQNQRAAGLLALGQALQAIQAAGGRPDVDALMDEYGVPQTAAAESPSPAPGQAPPDGEKVAASLAATEPRRLTGTVQGQLYADALADHAVAHARAAAKPALDQVLAVVHAATSYEDLRRRLVEAFGEMAPDELADLAERALVMANLAGRHAILEDL